MPLRDIDRSLLDRCLRKEPGAWNDFVDRYMGLIYHVIQHAAHARSRVVSSEDIEDIAAEVLLKIVDDDYAVLRRFKGISSLPTYLTVIARRTSVKELVRRHREEELGHTNAHRAFVDDGSPEDVEAVVSAEEVERMLERPAFPRGGGHPALPPEVPELPADQQEARHPGEFDRADPREGPQAAPGGRRAAERRLTQAGGPNPSIPAGAASVLDPSALDRRVPPRWAGERRRLQRGRVGRP